MKLVEIYFQFTEKIPTAKKIEKIVKQLEEIKVELDECGGPPSMQKYINDYLAIYYEEFNLRGKAKGEGSHSELLG